MDYDFKKTGQVIRRLRKQHGLSQDVLSGLAGISRTHLSMIESGDKNANVGTLWRIAKALDIPLSRVFLLVEKEHEVKQHYLSNA